MDGPAFVVQLDAVGQGVSAQFRLAFADVNTEQDDHEDGQRRYASKETCQCDPLWGEAEYSPSFYRRP